MDRSASKPQQTGQVSPNFIIYMQKLWTLYKVYHICFTSELWQDILKDFM